MTLPSFVNSHISNSTRSQVCNGSVVVNINMGHIFKWGVKVHCPIQFTIFSGISYDALVDTLNSGFICLVLFYGCVNIVYESIEVALVLVCYDIVLGLIFLEPRNNLIFIVVKGEGMICKSSPFLFIGCLIFSWVKSLESEGLKVEH